MPSLGIYSDPDELLNNVKLIQNTFPVAADATAFAVERIKDADRHIRFELNIVVDFSVVKYYDESPVATPEWLTEMSNHKACEMAYIRLSSIKMTDAYKWLVDYWNGIYVTHMKDLKSGKINLIDSTGNSVAYGSTMIPTPNVTGIKPYFGFGKWGMNTTDEDLGAARESGLEP